MEKRGLERSVKIIILVGAITVFCIFIAGILFEALDTGTILGLNLTSSTTNETQDTISNPSIAACSDNSDNDRDGWVDAFDPGCHTNGSYNPLHTTEDFVGNTQCSDQQDNEDPEDILVDGNDPSCYDYRSINETFQGTLMLPLCGDQIDNDGDSFVDYPADPGCTSKEDGSEQDNNLALNSAWVYRWDNRSLNTFDYITDFYWISEGHNPQSLDPAYAWQQVQRQPEGHRVMFSWDKHRVIGSTPSDYCRNSTGITSTPCIWAEDGVAASRSWFDQFFTQYKALGGKIDVMVLDYEEHGGWSYWGDSCMGGIPNASVEAKLKAIEQDPRFPGIAQQLGFSNLSKVICGTDLPYYLSWNNLVRDRLTSYTNEGVYEPIREQFPNVKMSDWDYMYNDLSRFYVPDANGHNSSYCGSGFYCSTGSHVGTQQSPNLYGWIGALRALSLDGNSTYNPTPFNAFRLEVNKVRVAKLSNPNVPVAPWITSRSQDDSSSSYLLANNDLYQETIFHSLLAGTPYFLYWNPYPPYGTANAASDEILDKTVGEFNTIAGFNDKQSLVSTLVPWNGEYVLTGMKAGGRNVWRFTPEMSSLPGNGITTALIEEGENIVLMTTKHRITIQQGTVWRPANPISSQGYWIIQPSGAPVPSIEQR